MSILVEYANYYGEKKSVITHHIAVGCGLFAHTDRARGNGIVQNLNYYENPFVCPSDREQCTK